MRPFLKKRLCSKLYIRYLELSFRGTIQPEQAAALYHEMLCRVETQTNRYYQRVNNVRAMTLYTGNREWAEERQDMRSYIMYDFMRLKWKEYENRHNTNRLLFIHVNGVLYFPHRHRLAVVMLRHTPIRTCAYYLCVWRRCFTATETVLQLRHDYGCNVWAQDASTTRTLWFSRIFGAMRTLDTKDPRVLKDYLCKSHLTHKYVDELFEIMNMQTVGVYDENTNKKRSKYRDD